MDWCVVYVDCDGEKKIKTFETKEKALTFSENVHCLSGVVTKTFYNYYIRWQREDN